MRAAQAGDETSYRRLLKEIALRLRARIRRKAPYLPEDEVEDLVQETLISVHLARASYDPARPFMPWLAAITHCRMVDAARRHGRRTALDLAITDLGETFCDTCTNNHAENVVNFLAVRRAIEALSPAERDAMVMLRLRQMTLAEAAAETGTSVAALKVAMHRAARRLRHELEGDGNAKAHGRADRPAGL